MSVCFAGCHPVYSCIQLLSLFVLCCADQQSLDGGDGYRQMRNLMVGTFVAVCRPICNYDSLGCAPGCGKQLNDVKVEWCRCTTLHE